MSDSVEPHRQQPTRLSGPWDSPGKNTGVGCHFLLQCMKVKSENEAVQSCPTLSNPMDCSTPGFPVHHQLRELAQTHVHCISDAIQPSHPLSSPSPAAAKSLQSCPTLCDPIDGSPPGFPILGILQARTLEWVSISFSNA